LGQELDAVAVLEAYVEEHAVDPPTRERGARLDDTLGGAGLEPGGADGADQALADGAVVVDDEDRGHGSPTIAQLGRPSNEIWNATPDGGRSSTCRSAPLRRRIRLAMARPTSSRSPPPSGGSTSRRGSNSRSRSPRERWSAASAIVTHGRPC